MRLKPKQNKGSQADPSASAGIFVRFLRQVCWVLRRSLSLAVIVVADCVSAFQGHILYARVLWGRRRGGSTRLGS